MPLEDYVKSPKVSSQVIIPVFLWNKNAIALIVKEPTIVEEYPTSLDIDLIKTPYGCVVQFILSYFSKYASVYFNPQDKNHVKMLKTLEKQKVLPIIAMREDEIINTYGILINLKGIISEILKIARKYNKRVKFNFEKVMEVIESQVYGS